MKSDTLCAATAHVVPDHAHSSVYYHPPACRDSAAAMAMVAAASDCGPVAPGQYHGGDTPALSASSGAHSAIAAAIGTPGARPGIPRNSDGQHKQNGSSAGSVKSPNCDAEMADSTAPDSDTKSMAKFKQRNGNSQPSWVIAKAMNASSTGLHAPFPASFDMPSSSSSSIRSWHTHPPLMPHIRKPHAPCILLGPVHLLDQVLQFLRPVELFRLKFVCRYLNDTIKNSPAIPTIVEAMEERAAFLHLRQHETKYAISPYMEQQPEINAHMRAVLVDWMIQVSLEFQQHIHTEFLAVRLLDRLLGCTPVPRREFQLVGVSCVLLAAKMEETRYPDLDELVGLCENVYTRQQLVWMETAVLKRLHFAIHGPTIVSFVKGILNHFAFPPPATSLCYYLSEIALLHDNVAIAPVSKIAVAIACLAAFSNGMYYRDILEYCDATLDEIMPYAQLVLTMQQQAPQMPHQVIRDAYMSSRHFEVGAAPPALEFLSEKDPEFDLTSMNAAKSMYTSDVAMR
jgi:Cyclin, N-terminal domain/Cyclin, C-terminal domain/F-box domain